MSSAAPKKDRTSAPPSLLEQVRRRVRAKHLSRRTEQAYTHWIKRAVQELLDNCVGHATATQLT